MSQSRRAGVRQRIRAAFCPTGPGGGTDNSCGAKGGGANLNPQSTAKSFDSQLSSKPMALSDVSRVYVTPDEHEAMMKLPMVSSSDLLKDSSMNPRLSDDFKKPAPAHRFIMTHNGAPYLINTEGYNYPRYIGKLKKTN